MCNILSFVMIGKTDKEEKEKKLDVKKAQNRRKKLFSKRVRVTRPSRTRTQFASTRSPPASSTTTNIESLRTTSRFSPPGHSADPLARLPATGTRSRGILGRAKPQESRGLFTNRRPSSPLARQPVASSPTSSVSSKLASSTTSITELQKLQRQLKQEEEKIRQIQASTSQKDEGGGRKDFLKQRGSAQESSSDSSTASIRCRFFRNSC